MTGPQLPSLILLTLRNPRRAAGVVLDQHWPRRALWLSLVLVSVIYTLTLVVIQMFRGPIIRMTMNGEAIDTALPIGLSQFVFLAAAAATANLAGRLFGGTGDFNGALSVVSWLQFVLVVLLAIQQLLFGVLPPLGAFMSVIILLLLFWLPVSFMAELHGFKRLWLTFLGVIGGQIILLFVFSDVLSLVFAMLGLQVSLGTGI